MELEEVVVTGIRAGIQAAVQVKAELQSITEVISAEDIGKLPDTSIADAISRMPGITTQRAAGRANYISIRGTDPGFSTTLMNGREQVSTGDNRAIEYDQYPAELINSVVVFKTPDSNIVGQGLSGTVVFYNPPMELNRDLAVCALQAYQRLTGHELVACEPLSGCGVRGIRLAKEVEGVLKIIVNDISPDAASLAEFNANMNGLIDKVVVCNKDANFLLISYAAPRKRFDYIDVDPFGSPVPYIDSALRALRNSGLIALTATDMAPLCGVHVKACLRKYGGKPIRTDYCHVLAVRLLIGCLAMQAAKQDIGVSPVFSYSDYNHVRTYATANYGAKKADNTRISRPMKGICSSTSAITRYTTAMPSHSAGAARSVATPRSIHAQPRPAAT